MGLYKYFIVKYLPEELLCVSVCVRVRARVCVINQP